MFTRFHIVLVAIIISLLAATSTQALHGAPNINTAGYSFIDSNSAGGPAHGAFTDISSSGIALGITDTDYANVTIPFSFTFFGVTTNQARISVKGHVLFNTTANSINPIWQPQRMPFSDSTGYAPLGAFPLWDNLVTGSSGVVYFQTIGAAPNRQFVVQWHNVVHANAPTASGADFAMVITEGSSDVLFQYRDTDYGDFRAGGAYAHIGVQRNGAIGYPYSYADPATGLNINRVSNGLNILFKAPAPPTVDQYFTPSSINGGQTTTLVYSLSNANSVTALTGVRFDNTLPAGLVVGDPAAVTTINCGAASFNPTLTTGAGAINLSNAMIDPGKSCTISVAITGTSAGQYINTIAQVQTNETTPQTSIPSATVTIGGNTGVTTVTTSVNTTAPAFPAPPSVPLCANLDGSTSENVRANVPSGIVTEGSAFCRGVSSPVEIGNADVISQGVLNAVDIFGMTWAGSPATRFNLPMTVCLQGTGSLIFLDAAQSPRIPQTLPATSSGGYTCGMIPGAGTVVLVNGPAAPAAPAQTATPAVTETALNGCRVTTTHAVRLRTAPDTTSSSVITTLPFDITLDATAHSGGWFRVIYESGQGWVSGDYVSASGDCG